MYPTRQELEDIMNNQPFGAGADLKRNWKKMKKHQVTIYGHKEIKVFEETIEVMATNFEEAAHKAIKQAKEKLGSSDVVIFKAR